MNICVINFSSRSNGNCANIARFVRSQLLRLSPSCSAEIIGFPGVAIHACGQCRYECFGGKCPYQTDAIQSMYDKMLRSDLLLSVVPIYGGLPCSNFFALSERAQGALKDDEFEKFDAIANKYIVVGNTGGSVTGEIIRANDPAFRNEDMLLIQSHDVGERSVRGNLMEYEYYQKKISAFIEQILPGISINL